MSKQTAVEWFWNQLPDILPFSLDTETAVKLQEAKEQAKAMEREQIVEAWCDEVPRAIMKRYKAMQGGGCVEHES